MEEGPPPARSLFGVDPLDDFAVFVADWIWDHAQGLDNIEVCQILVRETDTGKIEAKLGVLIDKSTNTRMHLPVFTETSKFSIRLTAVIDARVLGVRFESNMSMHASFNRLLNQLVAYSATLPEKERITYKHRKETDFFYDERLESGEMAHIRVTRDAKTQEIKAGGVVAKKRVADLNVYCPARQYDFRISLNTETPMLPPPESSQPTYKRDKDRLSYAHQNFIVDLTQVIVPNKAQEPSHELEVEVQDPMYLMQLGQDTRSRGEAASQEWSPYEDQVLVFLNNVRLLIRNADTCSV